MVTEAINHTRLVAFRRCRRLHRYMHWDGIRPIKKTLSLLFGEAWHAWLEAWLEGWQYEDRGWLPADERWVMPSDSPRTVEMMEDIGVFVPSHWLPVEKLQAQDPYEAARFRALALAYHLRWRKQDWRVLAVERKYEAPLVNPETGEVSDWAHRDGRIDAMVMEDGQQMLVESKSHEGPLKPGDAYFSKLRMDSQLSHYWIGAKSLGFEPQGIIYDVACKPSLDPLKATPEAKRKYTQGVGCRLCGGKKDRPGNGVDWSSQTEGPCPSCNGSGWKEAPHLYENQRDRDETVGEFGMRCFSDLVSNPDTYFHRVKVSRLDHEMHEHMLSDWQTVEQMRIEREMGLYPMNTDSCWKFNSACEFLPPCSNVTNVHDETLYAIRTRNDHR